MEICTPKAEPMAACMHIIDVDMSSRHYDDDNNNNKKKKQ
jgi:hypothetical protein